MHEILLPKMGNSVEDASIVEWFKQEGDAIEEGEPIFSMQTDKAEVECESTATGVLRKILVGTDVEVPVLSVVALVGTAGEALPDLSKYDIGGDAASATPQPEATPEAAPEATLRHEAPAPAAAPVATPVSVGASPVSPRAQKAALQKGIDPARLQGSGVGGRVMEQDVLAVGDVKATPVARRMAANESVDLAGVRGTGVGGKVTKADVAAAAGGTPEAPDTAKPAGLVPLSPMRRIIAERMAASKFEAPHYYVTVEIDMANAKKLRAALAFKASYNDLVLMATIRALREFPAVNAQFRGDAIEEMPDINLGMAVALPTGLIVPVIKQAQHLSLEGLCAKSKELATKAQNGKLLPDDYQGNTFTVSNLGAYGVDHFTAIINQPDSAIIAVGQMKDRVVAIDGGIHIRPIMKLTISSDHRVVDGALAAQFMGRLREMLEAAQF